MTVTVHVNGAGVSLDAACSLGDLLRQLGHAPHAVATAINGDFVPRAARDTTPLRSGDVVTFFQPIVGG